MHFSCLSGYTFTTMCERKIIASEQTELRVQQKALVEAFVLALKQKPLLVPSSFLDELSKKYNCSLIKLQRFFRQTDDPQQYLWKKEFMKTEQLREAYPGIPVGLKAELSSMLRRYRNPRRANPFPHLVWYKQAPWVSARTTFPVLGVTCLVREPVLKFNETWGEKSKHNLNVSRLTVGLVFHIGKTLEASSIRPVPGSQLAHTRLFIELNENIQRKESELLGHYFRQDYTRVATELLSIMDRTIESLGDTGFRYSDQ